jgi:hypothetical protein
MNKYIDRLKINVQELQRECSEQPVLYAEVGEEAVLARAQAKQAKLKLKVMQAETYDAIRKDPKAFDLDKATDSAVTMAMTKVEKVVAAEQEAIEALAAAEQAEVLVSAFDQRRSMLKAEVDLYVNNYYGDVAPTTRESQRAAVQQKRGQR